MNSWYFVSCALILVSSPAYAVDHDLLTNLGKPGVVSVHSGESPIKLAQQVRRRPAPPDPDLHDGQRWLCSVGQPPEINVQAFRRAKAKGWGYWSFAAHAGCPPGVYLTVASGGVLKNTGESVWIDEPNPGETLANYTATPTMTRAPSPIQRARALEYRQPQPVYYARSEVPGWGYGFGESNASCAACTDAVGVSSGATIDYGPGAWRYAGDGGSSTVANSGAYCASCNGR